MENDPNVVINQPNDDIPVYRVKNRMVKEKSEFYIEIYYFPSVHLQILMINQNQFLEKGNQSPKLEKFPIMDQLVTADLV